MGVGEVVRKVDSRRWLVRTEDGFELPMYESELVVDSPPELVTLSNKPTEKKTKPVQTEVASARVVQEPTEKVQLQRNLLTPRMGGDSLYLGFAPYDSQDAVRGSYMLYLIHESSQEVLITLSRFERTKCFTFS